ncbi:hypothetical protein K469DRAFT_808369 [Zopfia rhizophila CBS 207.26]|uniref:Uncharacterized protein n=1 Tax=Zopfia rhizophila CBS 207.26 TaxID=1314779 RepID=A0A6A6EJC1_9PEZI|nr:hypothetical protein K469DRAFT_808369 [Zopfia rhizophila CBS 207.26]
MLFSSVLSRHFLTNTLTNRNPDLALFLDRYIQYVKFYCGMRTVAHNAWPLLIESDCSLFCSRIRVCRTAYLWLRLPRTPLLGFQGKP